MTFAQVLAPLISAHLAEHGCSVCWVRPTPTTWRSFETYVQTTPEGDLLSITHKCRRCRAEAN